MLMSLVFRIFARIKRQSCDTIQQCDIKQINGNQSVVQTTVGRVRVHHVTEQFVAQDAKST